MTFKVPLVARRSGSGIRSGAGNRSGSAMRSGCWSRSGALFMSGANPARSAVCRRSGRSRRSGVELMSATAPPKSERALSWNWSGSLLQPAMRASRANERMVIVVIGLSFF
ncbi:MAG: hypothetical protein EXS55_03400 [Candidatus Magasanikbacteria bacterium]|nr:hypothetical protein [Candidatus Magasanikbacteria bacterium]